MSRIFFTLACLALVLMVVTLSVGLSLGQLKPQLEQLQVLSTGAAAAAAQGASPVDDEVVAEIVSLEGVKKRANAHRLLGIATGVLVLLVNCLAVTYFVGTARWCREVVEAYQLDGTLFGRSARMKRGAFFWAVIGMLTILTISSLGAMSDPMAAFANGEQYVTPHLIAAMLGVGLIAWSFLAQWQHILDHHDVIEEVLAAVQKIRAERGLDVAS
ncbi:MAG: hypothetical protein DWQ31_07605 [Planctomycetota bacterium]|nr:MAG: hypothetical protein DWQ31_07605 [Planctomycetota bacterium]